MAVDKLRRRRKDVARAERTFATGAPSAIASSPATRSPSGCPRSPTRNPTSGYLFYDCQTDDSRLVLTVLAEAERFGAVCANRLEVLELVEEVGKARGVCVRDRESGGLRRARGDGRQRDRGLGRSPAPRRAARRGRGARDPARAAARTSRCRRERCRSYDGAIVPAGSGRSIFALPWLGSTLIGTTDNDFDSDDLDHVQPAGLGHRVPARCHERLLRDVAHGVRPQRRLRRRAPADLDRRPEEVRRHLAQGRALRDEQRDDHDHRRQAHDLAADGEDDRRPDRRARRPRRALPNARDPARAVRRRRRPAARRGRARGGLRAARGPLRTPCQRRARGRRRARRARAADRPRRPAGPLAEAVHAARHEQARSVGDALLRRTRLGLLAARRRGADGEVASRVAGAMAPELGWDDSTAENQAQAFLDEARAEGIAAGSRSGAYPVDSTIVDP